MYRFAVHLLVIESHFKFFQALRVTHRLLLCVPEGVYLDKVVKQFDVVHQQISAANAVLLLSSLHTAMRMRVTHLKIVESLGF